ncbi:MAG: glycosyltransferase family 4 protein [Terrimicrobiaceae bacterium]
MKLLFLSSFAHLILDEQSTRTSGGAELQVALLARELAGRGHEVVIAAGDMGQGDGLNLQGVKIRNAGKFHTGRLFEMVGAIPRVIRVLREERPEWVIVMGWTAWLFILWAVRPFLGFRLDFTCALDSEINGVYRREHPVFGSLFEFAVRRCDARHAITQGQKDCFEARGMDCTLYRYLVFRRKSPAMGEKSVDFLWVSRCQPIKRPGVFVDLARSLPEASFEMICPAENRGLWDEVSARAGGCANLTFVESVPYHRIQEFYDRARIFVNTSEWEGWPNSFIQAGLGRAALLSLDVNPDGIFEKFGLGMFTAGDRERFVEAAREMLADPVRLRSMQDGCAAFVEQMHDNARETEVFLSGLRSLAGAGVGASA